MMEYERFTQRQTKYEEIKTQLGTDGNGNVAMSKPLFDWFIRMHKCLSAIEDKIEKGTLKEIPKNAVVLTDEDEIEQYKWSKLLDKMGFFRFTDKIRKGVAGKILTEIDDLTLCIIDGNNEFEKGYFQAIADMKTAIKDLLKEKYGAEVE